MDDSYDRHNAPGREYGRGYDETRYQRSGPDYARSSARDYAAAGYDLDRPRGDHQRDRFRSYGADDAYRGSYWSDGRRTTDVDRGSYSYEPGREPRDTRGERDFFSRAGDEIRSWFGDEEAERRREADARRYDDHYRAWRGERIAELDRDYDEYRRENARRFHNEFSTWRTEREGQRQGLGRVAEHMEVVGSDGAHVGTVDKVRGDRIILTKSDADAGGHHHSIPSRWIQSVDDKVTIRKSAEEAKAAWQDEERSGALFGSGSRDDDDRSWRGDHNLNRAFSGTY
jgi:hypothetical protein